MTRLLLCVMTLCGAVTTSSFAQTTAPVTDPDPMTAINKLRTELVDAFNKGDVDRLIAHLDDDIRITWQNGEVSRGKDGVRNYYNKMMTGPDAVVRKLSADPVVDDRHVYGDWAVSWGNLRDHYELKDGKEFDFNSRFTATIARRGDEWKVTAFHASVNAFDNPIVSITKKYSTMAAVGAGIGGIVVGLILDMILAKRKKARPTASGPVR